MQVYTGRPRGGGGGVRDEAQLEKNQGMRVTLDLTEGLRGRNVTCDNFFTSYELGWRLLLRGLTLVGTIRRNRTELPPALLSSKGRAVFSSLFAFTPTASLVSYLPKRYGKPVLLLSTLHARAEVSDRADRKPAVVLDYNRNKGGVDNLDKLAATYSCRRMTARWPLAVFHNILDVSAYNALVIWREMRPDWMPGKRNRRRLFLEVLGKELVTPLIWRRERLPCAEAAASIVRAVRREDGARGAPPRCPSPEDPPANKRKRCRICPSKEDRKTRVMCRRCAAYICTRCTGAYCPPVRRARVRWRWWRRRRRRPLTLGGPWPGVCMIHTRMSPTRQGDGRVK